MADQDKKISKISLLLQAIYPCGRLAIDEPTFVIKLLNACGSDYLTIDSSKDIARKLYSEREMSKNIRDGFHDSFDYDNGFIFLSEFIDPLKMELLFKNCSVDKRLNLDFGRLLMSILTQIDNYRKYKEDSTSDTVRNIYRRLLLEYEQQDDTAHKKEVFENLPLVEQELLKIYISKQKKKNEKINSVIHPGKLVNFYDIYVFSNVTFNEQFMVGEEMTIKKDIEAIDTITLLNFCKNNIFLEASGGLGKTMLMKHLSLNSISVFDKTYVVPILLNIHDYKKDEQMNQFIFNSVNAILENPIDGITFKTLLDNGMCLILLDGLDEIDPELVSTFCNELNTFSLKYSKNRFIVSSRPSQSVNSLESFSTLELKALSKLQSIQLIQKLDYDDEIKDAFIKTMKNRLFKTHADFCENPLLLTIMLLTWDKSGIPEKRYQFYRKCFDAMSEKYDPRRGKYTRSLATKLTPERLFDYTMEFCFLTYYNSKYSFTETEIEYYFNQLKEKSRFEYEHCTYQDFITDLEKHLCFIHKDGTKYIFIHRSFQEYFCAAYFFRQSDSKYIDIGHYLDTRKYSSSDGEMFYFLFETQLDNFLYEMNPKRMEEFMFLPYLRELLVSNEDKDLEFLLFLKKAYGSITYRAGRTDSHEYNYTNCHLLSLINETYDLDLTEDLTDEFMPKIDEFVSCGYQLMTNFQKEECIYDLDTQWEIEQARLDETLCGLQFSFEVERIINEREKFDEVIDGLKKTYLYTNFVLLKKLLNDLEIKYKKIESDNLVDILD